MIWFLTLGDNNNNNRTTGSTATVMVTSCSTTSCSTLTKDWFEDSSSEEEGTEIQNKRRHVRLRKGRRPSDVVVQKGRRPSGIVVQRVEGPMEVKVTLIIAHSHVVSLTARLSGRLIGSKNSTLSTRPPKKKLNRKLDKRKVLENNWRERPVHPKECGSFRRTIPGELCRSIIVAGRMVSSAATVDTDANGVCLLDDCFHKDLPRTRKTIETAKKTIKASRTAIREIKGAEEVGLLREHSSLLFPSHTQVANVIAKCLPWKRKG